MRAAGAEFHVFALRFQPPYAPPLVGIRTHERGATTNGIYGFLRKRVLRRRRHPRVPVFVGRSGGGDGPDGACLKIVYCHTSTETGGPRERRAKRKRGAGRDKKSEGAAATRGRFYGRLLTKLLQRDGLTAELIKSERSRVN